MKIKQFLAASLSLLMLVWGTLSHAGEYLSKDELTSLISGKTFDGVHLKKDFEYRAYASPDGMVTQVKDNGDRKTGSWSVLDNGKQCIEWDGSDIRKCFYIRDNGDGSYTKVKLKGERVIPLLRWKNFTEGNSL